MKYRILWVVLGILFAGFLFADDKNDSNRITVTADEVTISVPKGSRSVTGHIVTSGGKKTVTITLDVESNKGSVSWGTR